MKNKGELFVISGPSGVGKGVICKALLLADDKIRFPYPQQRAHRARVKNTALAISSLRAKSLKA